MTVSKLGKNNLISFKVSSYFLGFRIWWLWVFSASFNFTFCSILFVGGLPFPLSWLHSGTSPTLLLMSQMDSLGEEQPQQFWGWVKGIGKEAGTVVPLLLFCSSQEAHEFPSSSNSMVCNNLCVSVQFTGAVVVLWHTFSSGKKLN